ncbi:Dihydrolipoyllysine-residue acetyltransferase component of pyruvate dehydrogenase complex [Candidatus Gullanella endobia]|uniref:Acetyltransferase component of pyruvate dehydrogenase complex n=1 Tax=Candidatus Gullanella endobia TaxID=1070130 RepID=A0A143WRG2_9ENTR|nr:dihydrolipoyllysine-residue acetyltransferase [Candidatus Gullanella endobia]CUX96322.1 Dihydrolipoyllysine-residue acetyltransferase component of pyruvate dehydrogenase complex [Candidatus Gullanella endobia]
MVIEINTPDHNILDIGADTPEINKAFLSTNKKIKSDQSLTILEDDKYSNRYCQDINVPDIGDDEVEVTEVFVKVGDKIKAEQSLITVEGDKASIEIPAPFEGIVKELKINIGDKVSTGSNIMIFEVENTSTPILATENEKAVDLFHKTVSDTKKSVISTPLASESKNKFSDNDSYAHATPVIRRLAREFDINLENVKGTGRKGRILRENIQDYIKKAIKHIETASVDAANCGSLPGLIPWPKVDFSKFGNTEKIELGRIQKISGANLYRNWVMIPHVTQFDEVDITEVEAFRKQQNAEAKNKNLNVKITLLVFIMKAVAKALEELPLFNSSLSVDDVQKLTLKKYINIGIAVDTPHGLVVPVFRDVNKKDILELSRELTEISQNSRAGKLTTLDMQGGCFTISNLGGIGGTAFTPIINAPEVAILGISKSLIKPIWNGKEFIPRLMLPLSLSYDHRFIDGADGARFISFINNMMSDIRRLLM